MAGLESTFKAMEVLNNIYTYYNETPKNSITLKNTMVSINLEEKVKIMEEKEEMLFFLRGIINDSIEITKEVLLKNKEHKNQNLYNVDNYNELIFEHFGKKRNRYMIYLSENEDMIRFLKNIKLSKDQLNSLPNKTKLDENIPNYSTLFELNDLGFYNYINIKNLLEEYQKYYEYIMDDKSIFFILLWLNNIYIKEKIIKNICKSINVNIKFYTDISKLPDYIKS